jgi:hypothetical protein
MAIRYRAVSAATLQGALAKANKTMKADAACGSASVDAGFIIPAGQPRGVPKKGFQVFVKVCRYDEALLASDPDSGGLVECGTGGGGGCSV